VYQRENIVQAHSVAHPPTHTLRVLAQLVRDKTFEWPDHGRDYHAWGRTTNHFKAAIVWGRNENMAKSFRLNSLSLGHNTKVFNM